MTHDIFEETQRFNQIWLWVIIVCVSLMLIIQVPVNLINSSGTDPLPISSVLIIIFSLVFVIGINALFIFMRLKTKINDEGVAVIFRPFINKPQQFPWDDIDKAFVRKYKPLWEYGGWGIRYRWNSKAYNTSGNTGLQLIMKSGKKILIGTQKADELDSYLKKHIFTQQKNLNN